VHAEVDRWFGHEEPVFAESCPTHEVVLVVTGGQ
jgi:hypothetical protein